MKAFLLLTLISGAPSPAASPAGAVQAFYEEIVRRHPLGLPKDEDKRVLWPLLSTRLVRTLTNLQACEDDYFRQARKRFTPEEAAQLKPAIPWLEYGLFSGGNEQALPAEVSVTRVLPAGKGRFRVEVRFTYRDTFDTYARPPDESNTFRWTGIVGVLFESGRFAIDDFIPEHDGKPLPGLSKAFPDCKGPRWVGRVD